MHHPSNSTTQEQARPLHALRPGQFALLWAGCAVGPAVYRFAQISMPVHVAFAALAVGTLVCMLLVALLTRSAKRYGLGFSGLCRAALGRRGAAIVLVLRWMIGVVWLVMWAENTGRWMTVLLLRLPMVQRYSWLGRTVEGLPLLTWTLIGIGMIAAWYVMAGGVVRIARFAKLGVVLGIAAAGGLLVQGGNMSHGFGAWMLRDAAWDWHDAIGVVGRVGLVLLPVLLTAPDLVNVRRTGPWLGMVSAPAMATGLAFVGACLASASMVVRHGADFSPIADAAGFGGYAGAVLGVVLDGSLWIMGAPLWGFAMSSGALAGMGSRWHVVPCSVITLVCAIAIAPWCVDWVQHRWSWETLALWTAAPWGVLLADEWIWRRGKVWINALAVDDGSTYGAWRGVSIAGVLGLIAGWLFHPALLERWAAASPIVAWTRSPYAASVGMAVGMLSAAGIYLLVRPLEKALWQRLHHASAATAHAAHGNNPPGT